MCSDHKWFRGLRPLLALAACVGLLLGPAPVRAQGSGSREYSIKAAFLYNFVKFVDWPAQALPSGGGTLVIGVLGSNPFGSALTSLNGKSVKGKTISVRQVNTGAEAASCHVLFVPASEWERRRQVVDALKNSSVLTVGEAKDFAREGGVINFTVQNDRIRFEINPAAAERARLNLGSELLKLAKLVRS